jgi:hypothetical protein
VSDCERACTEKAIGRLLRFANFVELLSKALPVRHQAKRQIAKENANNNMRLSICAVLEVEALKEHEAIYCGWIADRRRIRVRAHS